MIYLSFANEKTEYTFENKLISFKQFKILISVSFPFQLQPPYSAHKRRMNNQKEEELLKYSHDCILYRSIEISKEALFQLLIS